MAVDSSEAFDDTARAAISFACDAACMADDGQEALDSGAFAFTDSGPYVGRSPAQAWPADPSDSGPQGGPQGGPLFSGRSLAASAGPAPDGWEAPQPIVNRFGRLLPPDPLPTWADGPVGAVPDSEAIAACATFEGAARFGLFVAQGDDDAPLFV